MQVGPNVSINMGPNQVVKRKSLYLLAAPAKQVLAYRKFFDDAQRNPVAHEGIEVGGEEASIIYYCHRGKWLELQGND
jgi:hypothetical protein